MARRRHRYLLPIRFLQVTTIDGHPVRNLGEFAGALERLGDTRIVRVGGITPTGATKVATVKLDPAYWPSSRLRYSEGAWQRENLSN